MNLILQKLEANHVIKTQLGTKKGLLIDMSSNCKHLCFEW